MSAETEAMVRDLAAACTSLQPLIDEHVRAYDEVLPHLLLADVHRYVGAALERDSAGSTNDVQGVMDFLEERFRQGGDAVQELISVSFVELLPRPGQQGDDVLRLLGPALAAEAERLMK